MRIKIDIVNNSKIRNWEGLNQNLIEQILGIVHSGSVVELVLDLNNSKTIFKKDIVNFTFKTLYRVSNILKKNWTDKLTFTIKGSQSDINTTNFLLSEEIKNFKLKGLYKFVDVEKILKGDFIDKRDSKKESLRNQIEKLLLEMSVI